MKRAFLFLFMLLASIGGQSQTLTPILTPQVLTSDGSYAEHDSVSLSQTIGELEVQTSITVHNILTQGFQQPFDHDDAQGIAEFSDAGVEIKLYPNPASDQITISILSDKDMNYLIYTFDALGRLVSQALYTSSAIGATHTMNISGLAAGIYILNIESIDKKISKSILFSKTNN